MSLNDPAEIIAEIRLRFQEKGVNMYAGEAISQTEHAVMIPLVLLKGFLGGFVVCEVVQPAASPFIVNAT